MAPDGRSVPVALAFRRRDPLLSQPPAYFADRQAITPDPLKHLSNHAGLFQDDLVACLAVSLAATDVPIAVRRSAENVHGTLTRRVPPPPPPGWQWSPPLPAARSTRGHRSPQRCNGISSS